MQVCLLTGGACLLLGVAFPSLAPYLAWDRDALLMGQLWRLWTGHLVHFSPSHAAADALVLVAAGLVVEPWLGARRMAALLLAGAAAISLGLLAAAPALAEYRGASGLGIMTVTLAGALAWRRRPRARPVLALGALLLGAKLLYDGMADQALFAGLPAQVGVAWQAHLLGAACGYAASCWAARTTAVRAVRSPTST